MLAEVIDIQTSLAIALASIPALVTVMWSLWQHNKRVDDARDMLRAEIKSSSSEVLVSVESVKQKIESVAERIWSVEADMKRALSGVTLLNEQTVAFTRESALGQSRIESVITDQKNIETSVDQIKYDMEAVQRAITNADSIVEEIVKPFAAHLRDIENAYADRIDAAIKDILKSHGIVDE